MTKTWVRMGSTLFFLPKHPQILPLLPKNFTNFALILLPIRNQTHILSKSKPTLFIKHFWCEFCSSGESTSSRPHPTRWVDESQNLQVVWGGRDIEDDPVPPSRAAPSRTLQGCVEQPQLLWATSGSPECSFLPLPGAPDPQPGEEQWVGAPGQLYLPGQS